MLQKAQKHLISDILQFSSKYRKMLFKSIFLTSTQVHNTGYKIMKPTFVLYKRYSKSAPPCICYSCWKEIEEQLGPELLAGLTQLLFSCPGFNSGLLSNWLTNKVFRAVQEKQYIASNWQLTTDYIWDTWQPVPARLSLRSDQTLRSRVPNVSPASGIAFMLG